MIRSELLQALARENPGLRMEEIEKVVGVFFDEMAQRLASGGRVELRGFGAFSTRQRDPRKGRNPRTGGAWFGQNAVPRLEGAGVARLRDLGITLGQMQPGPLNAITDVAGVEVGHARLAGDAGHHRGVVAVGHDRAAGRGLLGVPDHPEHRQRLALAVDRQRSLELVFLGAATLYALTIPLRGIVGLLEVPER